MLYQECSQHLIMFQSSLYDFCYAYPLQEFYGVLLQYFAVSANKKPLNFELLNMLVKPLVEMSMEIPYFAALCARERILRTREQFCEAVKSSGLLHPRCIPNFFLVDVPH